MMTVEIVVRRRLRKDKKNIAKQRDLMEIVQTMQMILSLGVPTLMSIIIFA